MCGVGGEAERRPKLEGLPCSSDEWRRKMANHEAEETANSSSTVRSSRRLSLGILFRNKHTGFIFGSCLSIQTCC